MLDNEQHPTARRVVSTLSSAEMESVCSLLDASVRDHMFSRLMRVPRGTPGRMHFDLLRAACAARPMVTAFLCKQVSAVLAEFAALFLGESYEDPSREELDDLTLALLYRYGFGPAALYYSGCIAEEVPAAGLLVEHFATGGLLCLDRRIAAVDILPARTGKATRERARKKRSPGSRAGTRVQAPRITYVKKRSKPPEELPGSETPGAASTEPSFQREYAGRYQRLSAFPGVRHDDDLVGRVFWTDVEFFYGTGSKTRPVVIVGIRETEDTLEALVLPLYSNDNKPAGFWRATEILEPRPAGLTHGGFAGNTAVAVGLPENPVFAGRLSPRDWNRLRIGEVH